MKRHPFSIPSFLALACGVLFIATLQHCTQAQDANPAPATLRGKLWNDDATGVTNATVLILRARSKVGVSALCATCYPDCQKSAASDELGNFTLTDLDPTLVFDLLVSASGYQTKVLPSVDPKRFHNDFTIPYIDEEAMKGAARLAGVILDHEGRPVAGCILNCDRFERGNSTQWGGGERYLESIIVSDNSGRFWSRCDESVTMVHARVDTRNAAHEWIDIVPGKDSILRLHDGVTVSGRVLQGTTGVPGIALGLTINEERMGGDSDGYSAVTGDDGSFTFAHVPAKHQVTLFAKRSGLAGKGAVANKAFQTAENGTKTEAGTLFVEKGFTIKGRIIPPQGLTLPEKTILSLSRNNTGDSMQIPIADDGQFEVKDLPRGSVWISLQSQGFKFSKKNPSLDWYNGAIVGLVAQDVLDLALPLEAGSWNFQTDQQSAPAGINMQPNDEPLRGAKINSKPPE